MKILSNEELKQVYGGKRKKGFNWGRFFNNLGKAFRNNPYINI